MSNKEKQIWAEMARRKVQFHPNDQWDTIRLWGLFQWGNVSHLIKSGDLITHMEKQNKTIWVKPSPEAYHKFIEPLLSHPLKTLLKMAGWE